MTPIYRNWRTSLPITSSEDKYFYLTNSEYYPHSNIIYIRFEDNNFSLDQYSIKYCLTNIDPSSYPNRAVSECLFSLKDYYFKEISSGTTKYYCKISTSSSYYYSIIYYRGKGGSWSDGNLYVTSDYNDLVPTFVMTEVSRNVRRFLTTINLQDKYFYLTNSEYYPYSNYIYICLEDNNFGLRYNNIKYCFTDTNPSSYPDIAIKNCSFISISYYITQSSSNAIKYYYNISNTNSYAYSIVYYDGNNSSGNLYATSDYKSISIDDNNDNNKGNKGLSTGVIIGIVAGSIVVLVAVIIIIYFFCPCCRKNKIDIIPDPNANEPENLLPNDNPDIQK